MKIYITNYLETNQNDIYQQVGYDLGFQELHLFQSTNMDELEINLRLEGLSGNVQKNDLVIVQIPFGNETALLRLMINKLRTKNAKYILLIHHMSEKILELCDDANSIIVKHYKDYIFIKEYHFENVVLLKDESEFDIKRLYFELLEQYSPNHYEKIDDYMHIAFGLYDKTGNYSLWVGVTMQSILEHTNSNVCFHILHDESLSDENKLKLQDICKDSNSFVAFHFIDTNVFATIQEQVQGYTIGSIFRILIPDVLKDLNKVLYLDADLYVNLDIKDLWDIDLKNDCIGAVKDIDVLNKTVRALPIKKNELSYDEYFNSGVLLMNLDEIRNHGNMKEEIISYLIQHTDSDLPDQDALNVVYKGKVKFIDSKYNRFIRTVRKENEIELKECIYHYVGTECVLSNLNEADLFYYKTILETPWEMKLSRERLKQSMYRTSDRIDTYELIINQLSNQKMKRIFIGENYLLEKVNAIISKRDEDIYTHDLENLKDILNTLRNEKQEFILFVSINVPNCIQELENMGLENQKDFFVVQRFLSNLVGGFI